MKECLLFLCACAGALGQGSGARSQHASRARDTGRSSPVRISAVVTDREGNPVWNIGPGQFRVFEDKAEEPVSDVTRDNGPVSIGILVDTSESMKWGFDRIKAGATELVRRLRPEDDAFLISFSRRPELAVPPGMPHGRIEHALAPLAVTRGTALIDAVAMGLEQLQSSRYPRKVLIILSDGLDTDSRESFRQVRMLIRQSDVRVYPLITSFRMDDYGYRQEQFRSFADDSGGRAFFVRNAKDLTSALEQLSIHRRYILAYHPRHRSREGGFRTVTVTLKNPNKDLKVFWKHSYVASVPDDYGSLSLQ